MYRGRMNRSFLALKGSDSKDSKNVFKVSCRRNWVDTWPFNRMDIRVQQPERVLKYRFATKHVNTCDLMVTHTNQKWSDVIMSLMSTILSVNNIIEKLWTHFLTRYMKFECSWLISVMSFVQKWVRAWRRLRYYH